MGGAGSAVIGFNVGCVVGAFDGDAVLAILRWLGTLQARRLGTIFDRVEQFMNTCQHGLGLKITSDSQHSVVGNIIHAIMLIERVTLDGGQISHVADNFMMVGMHLECRGAHGFG